jgi:NADH-quinone oxidoreductase subunit N
LVRWFLLSAGAVKGNYWFIIIAALNMIVSLYYYLKVIRVMFMEEPLPGSEKIKIDQPVKFALLVCAGGIVLAGVMSWIYDYITKLT